MEPLGGIIFLKEVCSKALDFDSGLNPRFLHGFLDEDCMQYIKRHWDKLIICDAVIRFLHKGSGTNRNA